MIYTHRRKEKVCAIQLQNNTNGAITGFFGDMHYDDMPIEAGDYIVQGADGNVRFIAQEAFERDYEPLD